MALNEFVIDGFTIREIPFDLPDKKDKRCSCGSGKNYIYGSPGGKRQCCGDCKTDYMVILTYKRCSCGSGKRPIYGPPGRKRQCCGDCKTDDMVNPRKRKLE